MLVKITRGLGGRKGLTLLVLTAVAGVVLVIGGITLRKRMLAPKGVSVAQVPPEKVGELGDKARGPSEQVPYKTGELARVTANAPVRHADQNWQELALNSVLKVSGLTVSEGESWVTGVVEGDRRFEPVTVHGSFLEPYRPVLLGDWVELADVKFTKVRSGPLPGTAVSGWLRNASSRSISYCMVTCVFQDSQEREVDTRRTPAFELPRWELVRFQTARSEKAFASVAIQIMCGTPEGLRDYLPTVVIQKSSGP
ncbi:MAG: hypothetical protein PCFJNLEI_03016 [Verrucomicrobiae bacterium]|nr:hypothetical protein [Verrucomicrobiae bacterium]